MTEAQWLACTDPAKMLKFLKARHGFHVSERQLRLFAVAVCRRAWHQFQYRRSHKAVEVAERYADGLARDVERKATRDKAYDAAKDGDGFAAVAASWADETGGSYDVDAALSTSRYAIDQFYNLARHTAAELKSSADALANAERSAQAELLRCIFGYVVWPTGSTFDVCPLVEWRKGRVFKLAEAAYEQRRLPSGTLKPRLLAVLADALGEAGCTDPNVLGHLRGPGPHVRGCWVVDMFLGKG